MTYEEKVIWLANFFKHECIRAKRANDYPSDKDNKMSALTVLSKLGCKENGD